MAVDSYARLLAMKALKSGGGGGSGGSGQDGVGVLDSVVQYNVSTSGTTPPASGWSASIPSVKPGEYLWTKTSINYTDGSDTVFYSVSRNGIDGKDGTNGTNGKDGVDGKDGADAPTITSVETVSVVVEGNFTVNNLQFVMSNGTTIPFVVKAQNGSGSVTPEPDDKVTADEYNALADRVSEIDNALFKSGYDLMAVSYFAPRSIRRARAASEENYASKDDYKKIEEQVTGIENLLTVPEGAIFQVVEDDGGDDFGPANIPHITGEYATESELDSLASHVTNLENMLSLTANRLFAVKE